LGFSANYERYPSRKLGGRFGIGFWDNYFGLTAMTNLYLGAGNHSLELGLGANFGSGEIGGNKANAIMPVLWVGYRYRPADGGINFKIGTSMIVGGIKDVPFAISPGIALGYGF
jgi:hypothetical protein